jgi:hypothetical protein
MKRNLNFKFYFFPLCKRIEQVDRIESKSKNMEQKYGVKILSKHMEQELCDSLEDNLL